MITRRTRWGQGHGEEDTMGRTRCREDTMRRTRWGGHDVGRTRCGEVGMMGGG